MRIYYKLHAMIRLLLLLFIMMPLQASQLPDFGDSSSLALTKSQERELGAEFMREIRRQARIIEDPVMTDYITNLGNKLVVAAKAKDRGFTFFIIDNNQINAFAGPDGNVGVFSGLILQTRNEGELAAVMAHEIAHVTQHHIARAYEEVKQTAIPTAAAMLAAIALSAYNPEAGAGALSATLAGTQQHIINFTRSNEEEADRVAIETLYNANINPQALPDIFENLERNRRLYGDESPEMLRTHPVTPHRIADAENRIMLYSAKKWRENPNYVFIIERLRVYTSNDNTKLLHYYQQMLAADKNNVALQYGYVLVLLKTHKLKQAEKITRTLIKRQVNNILFQLLRAEIYEQQNQAKLALTTLGKLHLLHPDNYIVNMHYAKTLIDFDKPQQAIKILQQESKSRPKDDKLFQLLSQAQFKANNRAEGYQARAKVLELHDNIDGAIRQIRLALKLPDNDQATKAKLYADLDKLMRKSLR